MDWMNHEMEYNDIEYNILCTTSHIDLLETSIDNIIEWLIDWWNGMIPLMHWCIPWLIDMYHVWCYDVCMNGIYAIVINYNVCMLCYMPWYVMIECRHWLIVCIGVCYVWHHWHHSIHGYQWYQWYVSSYMQWVRINGYRYQWYHGMIYGCMLSIMYGCYHVWHGWTLCMYPIMGVGWYERRLVWFYGINHYMYTIGTPINTIIVCHVYP
jgi:hypothetical protein